MTLDTAVSILILIVLVGIVPLLVFTSWDNEDR